MGFTSSCVVFGLLSMIALADGFSPLGSLPRASLGRNKNAPVVRMSAQSGERATCERCDRAGFLRVVSGAVGAFSVAAPPVQAYGQFAKIDLSGRGKDSQSGFGENDLPAAGKIDPYDNRVEANDQYGKRMQSSEVFQEKKSEAFAAKEKLIAQVKEGCAAKDWKKAHDLLNRDLYGLRRSMNAVSTRGARAVSAAQRGGDPEKALTKVELAEKKFLATMNKLSVAIDGEKKPVSWNVVDKRVVEAEADWKAWTSLIE